MVLDQLITTFRSSCVSSGSELRKELISAEGIRQDAPPTIATSVKDVCLYCLIWLACMCISVAWHGS